MTNEFQQFFHKKGTVITETEWQDVFLTDHRI